MSNRFLNISIVFLCTIFTLLLNTLIIPSQQENKQFMPISSQETDSEIQVELVIPSSYVVDVIATASFGVDMNDAGDVIGTSYPDPGCGSTCLPPLETVVWKDGIRIVLPTVPGLTGITLTGINNDGWICGFAGFPSTTTHAVVWKPNGNNYTAIDLGNLPGKTISTATGIDDFGRVVGWSTTQNFPPSGAPFLWTETGGMVNLTTLGFPNETPLGISPGGTVASYGFWYRLDDLGSITSLPAPPAGLNVESSAVGINDAGDQVRFMVTISGEALAYPFRYNHESGGSWQQLSFIPTGHLATYGIGSINDLKDITVTVQGSAMIAYGPDGLAQSLATLVSSAYGGSALTSAGPMNANGEIMARMIIGQSGQRLVRLIPSEPCVSNCIKVTGIVMKGRGPGFCNQGNAKVRARVTITDETGTKLPGVTVTGHFFDDYWLDETVTGTTDAQGNVTFTHIGPPCIGAIALLITDATTVPTKTLDRTTGILTNYVIPLPPGIGLGSEKSMDFDDDSAIEKIQSKVALDIPTDFGVSQNYPNPFNPSTTISYGLSEDANVSIIIYNALGQEVTTLINTQQTKGFYTAVWNGRDNSGTQVTSGIYFYRMIAGNFVEVKKMLLNK